MKKADIKRVEAAEMGFYRRLLRVILTDKRSNESVLKSYQLADRCLISLTKDASAILATSIEVKQQN